MGPDPAADALCGGHTGAVPLRVLTWNMAKRRQAYDLLIPYLDEHGVDVALLQEAPAVDGYRSGAWDAVWPLSSAPDCRIMARVGLDLRLHPPGPLAVFGHYAATATVDPPGRGVTRLASVHALARKVFSHEFDDADVEKFPGLDGPAWLSDLTMRILPAWAEGHGFIAGCDLNTSRRWGAGRLFDEAERNGVHDVTMRCWGEARPSFFTARSYKHQLDYVFADSATAESARAARIDTGVSQVQRMSDHAPILVDFA